ncbi:hypothetical protein WJ972_32050 [Achromobacter insuavis]
MVSLRRRAARAALTARGQRRWLPLARQLPLVLAAGLMLAEAAPLRAQGTVRQAVQYDIPAGPLAPALSRYAQQSGADIVLDVRSLDGLVTGGLQGRLRRRRRFRRSAAAPATGSARPRSAMCWSRRRRAAAARPRWRP